MLTINRERTCCFTGHRPGKLKTDKQEVITWLKSEIDIAVDAGYTTFISGMQRGVDIWAAEYVLELKKNNSDLLLVAASAFPGMEAMWTQKWIDQYDAIRLRADATLFVCNVPSVDAFFQRNNWMVDHASLLVAVYNNIPGGTKATIDYAKLQRLRIRQMPTTSTTKQVRKFKKN